jgi:hypothetical protein
VVLTDDIAIFNFYITRRRVARLVLRQTDVIDKESYSNAPCIRSGALEYDSLSMTSVWRETRRRLVEPLGHGEFFSVGSLRSTPKQEIK